MKITKLRAILNQIQEIYGDIEVTGGQMNADKPLKNVVVTNNSGAEVWPNPSPLVMPLTDIDGVFFE